MGQRSMPIAKKYPFSDFRHDLEYSNAQSDLPFWERFYRQAFPTAIEIIDCAKDMACQRVGIDRKIKLAVGQILKIDEKKRRKDYGDILLEYISVDTTGALGWIEKDLGIDYIAYACMESLRVYLLPFPLLRLAWTEYSDCWKEYGKERKNGFRICPTDNPGYRTWSVAVPTDILYNAIVEAAQVKVDWDRVLEKETDAVDNEPAADEEDGADEEDLEDDAPDNVRKE